MNYIVLDMEWNYPLTRKKKVRDPFFLRGEIIQIGAVKLDAQLEVCDSFEAMIRPEFYPYINRKVQKLTLITQSDVEQGISFEKAIYQFKQWCGPGDIILTWGCEDIQMLIDNLDFRDMDFDWIPEDFDAQWMFDDQVTLENRRYSLDYARFKFDVKGRNAHNALNDAYNTAEVLQHLNVAEWIEEERAYVSA